MTRCREACGLCRRLWPGPENVVFERPVRGYGLAVNYRDTGENEVGLAASKPRLQGIDVAGAGAFISEREDHAEGAGRMFCTRETDGGPS